MEEIKTGVEIYDAIDEATGNRVPELVKQKWVSVDWLKGDIEKELSTNALKEKRVSPMLYNERMHILSWVLSKLKQG